MNNPDSQQFGGNEAVEELVEVVRVNDINLLPSEKLEHPPHQPPVDPRVAIHHGPGDAASRDLAFQCTALVQAAHHRPVSAGIQA